MISACETEMDHTASLAGLGSGIKFLTWHCRWGDAQLCPDLQQTLALQPWLLCRKVAASQVKKCGDFC